MPGDASSSEDGSDTAGSAPSAGSDPTASDPTADASSGPGEPFEEHGHYIDMSSMDYTKVVCGFSSSGGGVWSNQNFSP